MWRRDFRGHDVHRNERAILGGLLVLLNGLIIMGKIRSFGRSRGGRSAEAAIYGATARCCEKLLALLYESVLKFMYSNKSYYTFDFNSDMLIYYALFMINVLI